MKICFMEEKRKKKNGGSHFVTKGMQIVENFL